MNKAGILNKENSNVTKTSGSFNRMYCFQTQMTYIKFSPAGYFLVCLIQRITTCNFVLYIVKDK